MNLIDVLRERRSDIESRWVESILSSYPSESSRFYSSERDPFRNPVGATVKNAVAALLEAVITGEWTESGEAALEAIVRLRSIQDMRPSQAVGFASHLKSLIRESAAREGVEPGEELVLLEERIDGLTLRSFDHFVACRDRVHELKQRESRARVYSLLRRAGMLAEPEEDDGQPESGEDPSARREG